MNKKSVYIAYTGGTIGMQKSPQGFVPVPGFLESELRRFPEFQHDDMPDYMIREFDPVLDSANMTPEDWGFIAADIEANYDRFDGFVILHGTDTMAYTASALSFMLEDLHKPVILTGSQIPVGELRSDARDNLIGALYLAAHVPIPEVCLYFHNRLLRGNRSRKVDASGFDAFDSPNYPELVRMGTEIQIRRELLLKQPEKPMSIRRIDPPMVGTLSLFPGINADVVRQFLAHPVQGLVLQTYGMGNAPSRDKALLAVLREACARGAVIVNVTQCPRGRVDMGGYETGNALQDCGVVSGHDMTTEAALAKLFYLFSLGLPPEEIRRLMPHNLRGELTPR